MALEGRLVAIEQGQQSGFRGVHERLDRLNGQVGRNTTWRISHTQTHAEDDAADGVRASVRKRDIALVGGGIGLLAPLVSAAAQMWLS